MDVNFNEVTEMGTIDRCKFFTWAPRWSRNNNRVEKRTDNLVPGVIDALDMNMVQNWKGIVVG